MVKGWKSRAKVTTTDLVFPCDDEDREEQMRGCANRHPAMVVERKAGDGALVAICTLESRPLKWHFWSDPLD